MTIYHIADVADWEKAKADGEYRISTRGRTLDEQGYIHASDLHQVLPVANSFYADADAESLLVLEIDPERLGEGVEMRYEDVPGSRDPFPHIFGPITPGAVTATRPLRKDDDGNFHFV
jgi:uncharacterized protein (DUF952 family)